MIAPSLLLAVALAQAASSQPAEPALKPPQLAPDGALSTEPLRIPGEISAAIMPYMTCMQASRGNNVLADPGDPRPPGVAVASDCATRRAESARRANEMLRAGHRMNAGRRQAFIEEALGNIDRHFLPNGPVPARPVGAMGSIDIPYQAIEAYGVYTRCVGGHFIADPRHDDANPEDVRQANFGAIAACRDVRAQQLARAIAAQTDIRVYGSANAARAAVRRAFDRFDSDYQIESVDASGPANAAKPTTPTLPDPAPQTTVQAVQMGSINIPDEIAPAIVPYFDCQLVSRGIELRLRPGQRDTRPRDVALGDDCSPRRAQAARRADDLLRGQHRLNVERRRALIETTLTGVDNFIAQAAPANAATTANGKNNAED